MKQDVFDSMHTAKFIYADKHIRNDGRVYHALLTYFLCATVVITSCAILIVKYHADRQNQIVAGLNKQHY